MNKYGWLTGSNTVGNALDSFLHPEDAYKEAEKASNQGYEESKGYQQPFFNNGVDQIGRLNSAENSLLNPGQLENDWASQYETSPYAKQMLDENQNQGLDAASSMGLSGSSAALGNIQQGAGNIVKKDRREFLNDLMEKYLHGIGLGQSMYGTGASAGANLGSNAMTHGNDVAGLRGSAQAAPGELFGQVAGGIANHFIPGSGQIFNAGNKYNAASAGA